MIDNLLLHDSLTRTRSRIVMLVVDGLGGVPHPDTGKSELETAKMPNLERLAQESACGLTVPVLPGITPGSGPGHLSLFGYDPIKYVIGRGALEAFGVDGVDVQEGDVLARGNFCTVDTNGFLIDRRAGRIVSKLSEPLCRRLDQIEVANGGDSVDITIYPVQDHRFLLRIRGQGLVPDLSETDPQRTGVAPLEVKPLTENGARAAQIANEFIGEARKELVNEKSANMVMLRGFSGKPHLPSMADAYSLNPAAIASYPMYRGLAAIIGMTVLATGSTFPEEIETLAKHYEEHDFFFIHYKNADAAGEDGDFAAKARALEDLDQHIPELIALKPDVLMVAGDHSTPAILAAHSWHPVPFLLNSCWTRGEGIETFSERACAKGSIGTIPAVNVMTLALSHAGKLTKFGA